MVAVVQSRAWLESQTPLTDADILAQLDRIRSSAEFDVPDRARKFLAYVIGEAIAGRADRIKAYSIAIEVFGRDASFDAQLDPVVRIQAGLIRRGLEHYYLVAGQHDPIVITMPKGGYVPVFSRSTEAAQPDTALAPRNSPTIWESTPPWLWLALAAAVFTSLAFLVGGYLLGTSWKHDVQTASAHNVGHTGPNVPKLVVDPFVDLSGTERSAIIARGLTDEVIGQLAKFKEIVVIAGRSSSVSSEVPAPVTARLPYVLEGRVRVEGEKLRISARLLDRTDGSVIWTNHYDKIVQVRNVLELEADIAQGVATALAQPYGIIFQTDASRLSQSPPDDWEAYACTLAYYGYRARLEPRSHSSVQSCLKRAVERFPGYATAWALLSLTYLDEFRFRYRLNSSSPTSLDRAAEASRRAVELDPQNVRALQSSMLVYFFRGDVDAALEVGARALAINPNDTELSGEYGFRLALSGEWEPGCKLVSSAVSRNPAPPGYFEAALAVCAYVAKDYTTAERWAQLSDLRANPIYHVILMAILGKLGRMQEADVERLWLETHAPTILENIRHEVAARIRRPEDQLHFIEGLAQAGLSIPEN